MKRIFLLLALVIILLPSVSFAAPEPVIFYSDLTSGPNNVGKDEKGVWVTINGKNFGNEHPRQNANNYVTVGGGRPESVNDYVIWSDTKIVFQIGRNAQSGNIQVHTLNGTSNGVSFVVRSGRIFFVDDSATSDGLGTFDNPWRSPASFYNAMRPGDTCYIREGIYQGRYGRQDQVHNINISFSAPSGQLNNEIAWVGYPGETALFRATGSEVGNILFGYDKEYYVISSLSFYSDRFCIWVRGSHIRLVNNKCEGLKYQAYKIIGSAAEASYVQVYGCELFGATSG